MSLFDTQDLAEITHPDYPDERLIACRNPALAGDSFTPPSRPDVATAGHRPGHDQPAGR